MSENRPMTITEFLEARIAEDEAGGCARILAECAAKRAVIELSNVVGGMDDAIIGEWGGPGFGAADDILHALAAVYKDHPDYQQEWSA